MPVKGKDHVLNVEAPSPRSIVGQGTTDQGANDEGDAPHCPKETRNERPLI